MSLRVLIVWLVFLGVTWPGTSATYYVDALRGVDRSVGTRPDQAWRSLARASQLKLAAGDTLLLFAGQTHPGSLTFHDLAGTAEAPITFGCHVPEGTPLEEAGTARALIDAQHHPHALHLDNPRHVLVRDLILQANGGNPRPPGRSTTPPMRCGVRVTTSQPGDYGDLTLQNLWVRDIYYENPGFRRSAAEVRSANGTQSYGWGIRFFNETPGARLHDLTVRDCLIENTEHTGLKFTAPPDGIQRVHVVDNEVRRTGGPGIQLSGVTNGRFSGNRVDRPGHAADSRQWGRGSGLWTWSSRDILIEHNRFTHANGPGDSAGCHIDFNCRNVVVQYNFSAGNAGGFCEILGNNHNCAYRYNISVDDGHRRKGERGAFQEGKILWLSGYTGEARPPRGPFNSYIYNNTIYTSASHLAQIALAPSSDGILIANNIFHLRGPSRTVGGDQNRAEAIATVRSDRILFANNLYLQAGNWPTESTIQDANPLYGDPVFIRPGGREPADYVPQDPLCVKDLGLTLAPLRGDTVGLAVGLAVTHDILGQPIVGTPDLGAIESP